MNYIGSKYSLLDFLTTSVNKTLEASGEERKPHEMVFADLLAGTGAVGKAFYNEGYNVIANDIQYYSYVTLRHLFGNAGALGEKRCDELVNRLNAQKTQEGFIYKNYSYGGTDGQEHRRLYFSDENAKRCDGIRTEIERLKDNGEINENEYYFLLASLVNSMDKYANTASVYGAYLKKLKKTAQRDMVLSPLPLTEKKGECEVYNEDVLSLLNRVSGDILYLDPPYNARQYCTNYHLLETIARYDEPTIKGKTGLRDYSEQKSKFCSVSEVENFFAEIIKHAKFKYIFLSYNNEGLMSFDRIEKIMRKYGKYKVYMKEYHRYKADSSRETKADNTVEYLHCLIKK